jgi:hypothetical protein
VETPFGFVAGDDLPDAMTLSPWDPIFLYHGAILWTGLNGVSAAIRTDKSTATFGRHWTEKGNANELPTHFESN